MFPISDATKRNSVPVMNYLIILANVAIFIIQSISPNPDAFIVKYSFIPAYFNFFNVNSYIPLFTSLFIHGSILHIASNMWFLHIFGDNVEDRLGHIGFLFFYLVAGLIATFTQYILSRTSTIPQIGASGAISGAAGAYFLMFMRSKVKTLVISIVGFFTIIDIPAYVFLGYWFFLQIVSGIASVFTSSLSVGGVAWFAHVGGFLFGALVAVLFSLRKKIIKLF